MNSGFVIRWTLTENSFLALCNSFGRGKLLMTATRNGLSRRAMVTMTSNQATCLLQRRCYGNGSSGGSSYLALDATSNVPVSQAQYWTADNNVWTMTSSGAGERYYLFSTGYAFGGIVQGTYIGWMGGIQATTTRSSIALDRAVNVWIANATPVTVSWGSTSGLTGLTVTGTSYTAAGMDSNAFAAGTASGVGAYSAVPDSAGNVWVANTDGTVSQMLGLATPVVTPLVPSKFATTPWRDRWFEP
jgi:hypothetical protein